MSKTFRLGAFFLVTLAILAFGIFELGSKEFLFSTTYRVRSEFQNVSGLAAGADVRVGGIRQGTVRSITLPNNPDGKIVVTVDLDRSTHNLIKKDSVASIKSEGLLGDKYVEVGFGSESAEKVKDNDLIASAAPVDMSDLMKTTSDILTTTKETIHNVDSITSKMDRGEGTMGALINDKAMYKQATAATAQAAQGATAFKEDMEAMKHNFFLRGFFKSRGYENESDLMKYATPALPAGNPIQDFTYDADPLFDKKETAKLTKGKELNKAGAFLQANHFSSAVVVAYTGLGGDTAQNKILTEARALVVREYLVKNYKFDDKNLKTLGMGESKTIGEKGRIEVVVYP